jgi:tetratricopeptide (TPR) repeat protein
MASTLSQAEEAQLAQTVEMFEVITESQPSDYQSLEILKEAYFKLGREKDVVKTAKRIAEAYVQMGQLSSAILEYETILQRFPDDPDVQTALQQIESKASNLAEQPVLTALPVAKNGSDTSKFRKANGAGSLDDGRAMMYKIFVEGKIVAPGDFDLCWITPDLHTPPSRASDPFIQLLHEKGVLHVDKSLKLLSDKSRLAYLPLEKYEVDLELARSFPADICRRWCVLPFDRMSKSILVATANPFNQQAARDLAEATHNRVLLYLAPPAELAKTLQKVFR